MNKKSARDTYEKCQKNGQWIGLTILSSRGCAGNCSFCDETPFAKFGSANAWRARSPHNVVDEIEYLVDTYHPDFFLCPLMIIDANFLGHTKEDKLRAENIAKEILKRNISINFSIACRADSIYYNEDKELIDLLVEAGCVSLYIGVESGENQTLEMYNKKNLTPELNHSVQEFLLSRNLRHTIGFIPFHPLTTMEDLRHNFKFLKDIGLSPLRFANKLRLYPGTSIINRISKEHLLIAKKYSYSYKFRDFKVSQLEKILTRVRNTPIFDIIISFLYLTNIWFAIINKKYLKSLDISQVEVVRFYYEKFKSIEKTINEIDYIFIENCITEIEKAKENLFIDKLIFNYMNRIVPHFKKLLNQFINALALLNDLPIKKVIKEKIQEAKSEVQWIKSYSVKAKGRTTATRSSVAELTRLH